MRVLAAATNNRSDFVNAVWNLNTRTGNPRYYAEIMQLLALLRLSGQMRMCCGTATLASAVIRVPVGASVSRR